MLETDLMAEGTEIDLVKYGVLWQKVQDMDKKVDKMERNVEELLALANKGKGGLWFGMTVVSGVSVVVGYFISIWKH
jgi:hypothetical protein|tara:strand:+ start:190 stop:420 length:231 start_codon:yes stop_codon:yes gene_type:complete